MWERIFEIVRKELRQSLRNPRVRMTMIVPPILQTIIFGYAVNLDVEHVRLAVMDLDRSETSRDLIRKFTGSPYFTLLGEAQNDRAAQDLIDRGDVDAVVRIPVHFGEVIGALAVDLLWIVLTIQTSRAVAATRALLRFRSADTFS